MAPLPLIVDSDGGCDDAAALWWALTDRRVEVVAVVATWGNCDRDQAAANLRLVCEQAGRPDVPVALGAAQALGPSPTDGPRLAFHGADGLGGFARPPQIGPVDEPGRDLLLRLTAARPGEIGLLTLGPLSTVADAVLADAGFAARTRNLTAMAGSLRRGGNVTPAAEANVGCDPEAAAIVVGAGWPDHPLLVGLDVTLTATLGPAEHALVDEPRSPAARFLAGPLLHHQVMSAGQTTDQPVHDLLAAVAAADPDIVAGPVAPLAVDTRGGPAWGATVADLRGTTRGNLVPAGFSPWHVALTVDVDRFRAEAQRLLSA